MRGYNGSVCLPTVARDSAAPNGGAYAGLWDGCWVLGLFGCCEQTFGFRRNGAGRPHPFGAGALGKT
jgi:hypothetical protein